MTLSIFCESLLQNIAYKNCFWNLFFKYSWRSGINNLKINIIKHYIYNGKFDYSLKRKIFGTSFLVSPHLLTSKTRQLSKEDLMVSVDLHQPDESGLVLTHHRGQSWFIRWIPCRWSEVFTSPVDTSKVCTSSVVAVPFEINKTPFFSLHDAALLNCPVPFKVPEFLCDIELVQSKQGIPYQAVMPLGARVLCRLKNTHYRG